jgi:hypothetical protein
LEPFGKEFQDSAALKLKALLPISNLSFDGLHVSSQYYFECSFWTDFRLSILLNASSMSADEDFIPSALQWLGNIMTFKRRLTVSRNSFCHNFDVTRLTLDAV